MLCARNTVQQLVRAYCINVYQSNLQIFGDQKASPGARDSISSLATTFGQYSMFLSSFILNILYLRDEKDLREKSWLLKEKWGTFFWVSSSWNALKASNTILCYGAGSSGSWDPVQQQVVPEVPRQHLWHKRRGFGLLQELHNAPSLTPSYCGWRSWGAAAVLAGVQGNSLRAWAMTT